ncbi:MAG: tRNA epoxyqueuosine(34) reductase QueG [Gemmatimonadota bacterium]|nr:tRNA epoxyqueuosine(34) reductase QueG [Gemmatimonadota bacterium]
MTSAVADTLALEDLVKAQAYGLGFDLVGIASLGPMETAQAFDAWVEKGYAGEMDYLLRGAEKRRDSRLPFPGAVSAIVVGLDYGGREPSGPVARYARGDDYHDVMTERLNDLHRWLQLETGHSIAGKAYVDTGPILERDLARRAGMGWFGKNTNLVNPRLGSFFFIGSLLVDLELAPDSPFEADRCGTCTRCLDACPTNAFVEPRVLDANRCISYLTIELKGEIPQEFHEAVGSNIYGCDICQDVCPYNIKFARELQEPAFAARQVIRDKDFETLARELIAMEDDEFRSAFKGSPMKRAKRRGLARNAGVVLENILTACVFAGCVAAPIQGTKAQITPTVETRTNGKPGYTAADVRFMRGMIAHHAQALAMTALLHERTTRADLHLLAQRIEVSQKDEIGLMQHWLERRNEAVPKVESAGGHRDPTAHSMSMAGMDKSGTSMSSSLLMPGMLTTSQLADLAKTRGAEFDQLFLQDMIRHHEGALVMVRDLLATNGAAQEPEVFQFASDIEADQRAEIMRMRVLLTSSPGAK